jgi:hypothetical protein
MWHTSVHFHLNPHLLLHTHFLPRVIANSIDDEGQAKKKAKHDLEPLILLDPLYLCPNPPYQSYLHIPVTILLLKHLLEILLLTILLCLYITLLLFMQLACLLLMLHLLLLVVLLMGPPAPHFLLPPPILPPLIPRWVLQQQWWVV